MKAKPKFLGVCSYIANTYEIDVFAVRLAAIGIILTSGIVPGLIGYFVVSFLVED